MDNIINTGWTPTVRVTLPTKAQLILLRDTMLKQGNQDIAAAVDNVIDLLVCYTSRVIDTAENVNVQGGGGYLNGAVGIHYVPEPAEVKAQADAVCEEYEEAYRVADNFDYDSIKEIPF